MQPIIEGIVIGAGGTVLAAFTLYLIGSIRKRMSVPVNVEQLQRGVYAILKEDAKQNEAMVEIVSVQQTMLEVIRDGKINGNIRKAIGRNEKAGECISEASRIEQDFSHAEATGQAAR